MNLILSILFFYPLAFGQLLIRDPNPPTYYPRNLFTYVDVELDNVCLDVLSGSVPNDLSGYGFWQTLLPDQSKEAHAFSAPSMLVRIHQDPSEGKLCVKTKRVKTPSVIIKQYLHKHPYDLDLLPFAKVEGILYINLILGVLDPSNTQIVFHMEYISGTHIGTYRGFTSNYATQAKAALTLQRAAQCK